MKTLDEMIKELEMKKMDADEAVKFWKEELENAIYNPNISNYSEYEGCLKYHQEMAEDCGQLIEWLNQLKAVKHAINMCKGD